MTFEAGQPMTRHRSYDWTGEELRKRRKLIRSLTRAALLVGLATAAAFVARVPVNPVEYF